jgi:homoserine O-acetyltransferase
MTFEEHNDSSGEPLIQHAYVSSFKLCCGEVLEDLRLGFCVFGRNKDNPLVILHPALTGSPRAAIKGKSGQGDGWFSHCLGSGKMLDTDKFTVVCFDHLGGNGATTSAKEIKEFSEKICFLDEINLIVEVLQQNKIDKIFAVIGGSIGGGQALDWLLQDKIDVRQIIDISGHATNHGVSKEFFEIQRDLLWSNNLEPQEWVDKLSQHLSDQLGKSRAYDLVLSNICRDLSLKSNYLNPTKMLGVVRKIGFLRFVTPKFFQDKWDNYRLELGSEEEADAQIDSWITYQGDAFPKRFSLDALAQLAQLDVAAAAKDPQLVARKISKRKVRVRGFAVEGDILFPASDQRGFYQNVAEHLPDVDRGLIGFVSVEDLRNGHDHFLTAEFVKSADIIKSWLL